MHAKSPSYIGSIDTEYLWLEYHCRHADSATNSFNVLRSVYMQWPCTLHAP